MTTGLWTLLATVVIGGLVRLPLALVMFAGGAAYLFATRQDIGLLVGQVMNQMTAMYVLVAIPMFILAANFMNAASISDRLWAAANALVGRFRGGMGHVTVVVSMIFSSMSGSAVTDAAGPGLVATRQMQKIGGYPAGLACAITAASATIAPIIPPSIPLVIYALISGASIGALFLAGLVPGVLMGGALMLAIRAVAGRRDLPVGEVVPIREMPAVFGRAALSLTLPVVLLGGIWTGIFTPTEAAAVAAFWALILGAAVYRRIGFATLGSVFGESARQSAGTMLLIASAFILNYAIANEGLAARLALAITDLQLGPLQFMGLVNLLFLVLGCFLDGSVMMLVFVPLILPSAKALGIDLTYFGIIVTLNFMIGLITPPYGLLLFVMASLTRVPLVLIIREIWPFVLALGGVLAMLTLFPSITLFLPHLFGYE
ncbi:TRAP transporter large permease [Prosthecodimorpha staleyi]|uniref:TRAP transporter large permease protein n=1 Tax=Prosthecodimorpha staleyi TaxID=2840188 RepID=A0A947GEX1_9HYPH|nr:TRAP transporter large permease [Prosthecodimorpha staleyi]MBT9289880.1 TRAP transporter large permease [Prosthecodimorpha staleyi]